MRAMIVEPDRGQEITPRIALSWLLRFGANETRNKVTENKTDGSLEIVARNQKRGRGAPVPALLLYRLEVLKVREFWLIRISDLDETQKASG